MLESKPPGGISMSRVLITGGAGFIGSHTADLLLRQGHTVRILDCLDPQVHGAIESFPGYIDPAVECVLGDVRDPDAVEAALDGVDAVYHLASLTGVGQSMYDMKAYVETNCGGTATVLEVLVKRKQKLRRFVLASSRAVYGEGACQCEHCGVVQPAMRQKEEMERGHFDVSCPLCSGPVVTMPTAEDSPLTPISTYAWTKKHQEELCQYAARTFCMPVTILRYFNVYGPRQSLQNPYTGVVSIFYSRLVAGQPISIYERGKPVRDFIYVADVARANVLALDSGLAPGICINVGSGTPSTILDVARALGNACGRVPDLQDKGEFRVGDIYACYADLKTATRLLRYAPEVTLGEGMAAFAVWANGQEAVDLYPRTVAELERHGLFGRVAEGAESCERT
jgi:dTDP-L-rhamnose 4-epimerase